MNRFKAVRLHAETHRCELLQLVDFVCSMANATLVIEKHVPCDPLDEDDIDPEAGESIYMPCEGYEIASTRPPPLRRIEE